MVEVAQQDRDLYDPGGEPRAEVSLGGETKLGVEEGLKSRQNRLEILCDASQEYWFHLLQVQKLALSGVQTFKYLSISSHSVSLALVSESCGGKSLG